MALAKHFGSNKPRIQESFKDHFEESRISRELNQSNESFPDNGYMATLPDAALTLEATRESPNREETETMKTYEIR